MAVIVPSSGSHMRSTRSLSSGVCQDLHILLPQSHGCRIVMGMALFAKKKPAAVGTVVPDIALPDQDGTARRLSDYRGKKIVLFFYPKDDTPG